MLYISAFAPFNNCANREAPALVASLLDAAVLRLEMEAYGMNCPHCNTHIDEHPASRCLDYWIAKDVLDLTCLHDPPTGILLPVDIQVKPYSTDIAAAWEVVEKLNTVVNILLDGGGYVVRVGFAPGHIHRGYADTAPLAICRAAIKAVQG